MRAFVITLHGNSYSEAAAGRCAASAARHGIEVTAWRAVSPETANLTMEMNGLKWTWANDNTSVARCPTTGLRQHPYKTADQRMRIGCSMSHYLLWEKCVKLAEPILILEHDAVVLRPLPQIPYIGSAVMINDPRGATPNGDKWAAAIGAKGPGIHAKTVIFDDERPDGLAGGSAYIIAPHAAAAAMAAFKHLGVWPNDATLCRQIIGGLRECFPFVTCVRADKSMAGGY